jgi:hypothetical protein
MDADMDANMEASCKMWFHIRLVKYFQIILYIGTISNLVVFILSFSC